jgi:hypothetical protein
MFYLELSGVTFLLYCYIFMMIELFCHTLVQEFQPRKNYDAKSFLEYCRGVGPSPMYGWSENYNEDRMNEQYINITIEYFQRYMRMSPKDKVLMEALEEAYENKYHSVCINILENTSSDIYYKLHTNKEEFIKDIQYDIIKERLLK